MYSDKLYIHTNKYEVVVSKAKFVVNYNSCWPQVDFETLQSIYCYKDGYVRYLFCDDLDRKRTVMGGYLNRSFEKNLNRLIEEI